MKRILVLLVLITGFSGIFAQESAIQEDMAFFTQALKIENSQRQALSKIIIRKHSDLESIAELRNTDEALFRQKRRNIYSGTQGSIKLLLNEGQMKYWQDYKITMRKANGARIQALKNSNADREDLLDAQHGIPQ